MEIQQLQARVIYLAGAMDEAKQMLNMALKEIEEQKKKEEEAKAAE